MRFLNPSWRILKYNEWTYLIVLPYLTVFFIHILIDYPRAVLLAPDSASYIVLSEFRTPGYGLFLKIIGVMFEDYYAVGVAQLFLAFTAIFFVSRVVERVLGVSFIAVLLAVLLATKGWLVWLHLYIGPDSLFFTALTFHLGFAILLIEKFSPLRLIGMGCFLVLAAFYRPIGYAFFPISIFFFALTWGWHERRRSFALLLFFVLAWLINVIPNYLLRGQTTPESAEGYSIIVSFFGISVPRFGEPMSAFVILGLLIGIIKFPYFIFRERRIVANGLRFYLNGVNKADR